jgi:hypothetical protein
MSNYEQRIAEIEMQVTTGRCTREEADRRIAALKALKAKADSVKDHKIIT